MTALNLPENFTSMFVKIRYGNATCLSETVDSKVAPVWTTEDSLQQTAHLHTRRRSIRRVIPIRRTTTEGEALNNFDEIAER